MTIALPQPDLQIDFAAALDEIRSLYLQDALSEAVKTLSVPDIDRELAALVPAHSLTALAAHGIRGEMIFAVPLVLTARPRLLGYYRLLLGYSQKEFYTAATGVGRFKAMEERGVIGPRIAGDLAGLCQALCTAGTLLLAGIGGRKVSATLLDDLTLLFRSLSFHKSRLRPADTVDKLGDVLGAQAHFDGNGCVVAYPLVNCTLHAHVVGDAF